MKARPVSRAVIAFAVLFVTEAFGAEDAEIEAFQSGVQAYRQGDYALALDAFGRAQTAGLESPAMHYNLGATHYRLGNYAQATDAFKQIGDESEMAPLAHYNLGLIAFREGHEETAAAWFRRSYEEAEDARLKELAGRMLERARRPTEDSKRRARWSAYLSAAVGYDDNVTLENTDLATASSKSDQYLDLYAAVNGRLAGTPERALWLDATASTLSYEQVNEYDDAQAEVGLRYSRDHDRWKTSIGAYLERLDVGGSEFQRLLSVRLRGDRQLGEGHELRLHYEAERIDDLNERYAYLSGSRQQARVEMLSEWGMSRWRLGYTLELNDREDLEQPAAFTSYSATRQTARVAVYVPVGGDWRAGLDADYRQSRYNDPNISAAGTVRRVDDRFRAALKLIRPITADLDLLIHYRYTSNDSNLITRRYDRNQFGVGLRLFF